MHAAHTRCKPDWRALEEAMNRRFEFMEQATAARQQQGQEAAAAIVGGGPNRQLHDEIEALVGRIKQARITGAGPLERRTRQTAQTVKQLILLGGCCA
jgi:CHASE3 domain sensor protein